MANLLLTEKCVRACPYCFAKAEMAGSAKNDVLPWDNLIYVADFFEISHEKHISLLGGEPTLHPNFVDFVLYLVHRNFHVTVFTSGIVSEAKLEEMGEYLGNIDPNKLSFVCNLNEPKLSSISELEKIEKFLFALGHFVTPGFNIFELGFSLDFIFRTINQFGLRRNLRLGLAHPIPFQQNKHIPIKDFPIMAEKLISYIPAVEKFKIALGFDCGFPLCIFTNEQIGKLFKTNKNGINFGCGPAIDIGSDLSVWPCFPLSNFQRKSIYDFDRLQDIGNFFQEVHRKVRIEEGGIYRDCDECSYRENGMCFGGCISYSISKFQNEPKIRLKEVYI